jgi:hypothetical protein
MSKTWNWPQGRPQGMPRHTRTAETPQAAIERLNKMEAEKDIREALAAPQEATNATQ